MSVTSSQVRHDSGFTLVELLITVAIISIITAIATPGLLKAKMTANESSAIAALKITTSSQVAYSATCGSGGYASGFIILGTPPAAGTPGYIPQDLALSATPTKSGYQFTLTPGAGAGVGPNDCNGTATATAYYASATPLTLNTTGARSFAVSASATLWQLRGAVAPTEPFGLPATIVQ